MQQTYHSNSVTNVHIRKQIRADKSSTNAQLAERHSTSPQTISKWRHREDSADRSCAPTYLTYALSDMVKALIGSIRRSSWMSLDELWEMMLDVNATISRSSVYRELVRQNLNVLPVPERQKAMKFKEYQPGYLHIDVTYLPKFNGKTCYLYVAIDRATRAMYYQIFDNKTSESTDEFLDNVIDFFPFFIEYILTDNGLEFTNHIYRSKKGEPTKKPSKMDLKCEKYGIDHRLTKPCTPKTNGMVERVNGTIKKATILKTKYATRAEMEEGIADFLGFYNLYKRHGSLRSELRVKTPIDAVFKWYELEPNIFHTKPEIFKQKLLDLHLRK